MAILLIRHRSLEFVYKKTVSAMWHYSFYMAGFNDYYRVFSYTCASKGPVCFYL